MTGENDTLLLDWDISFPLATNRFFLYDLLKLIFWTFLGTAALLTFMSALTGSLEHLPRLLPIFGLIMAGFLVLALLIALVFFGNRYPAHFALGEKALYWSSRSRRARRANRLAVVLGALSGKPSVAGAGLLAEAKNEGHIGWKDVRRFKEYPSARVVSVKNCWRVVTRLYCTPDNYDRVCENVRRLATRAGRAS